MSSVQYPFIDIAVHDRVRAHFAAGKALALFSQDMTEVLWANGGGAELFGARSLYDFLDHGPPKSDLTLRQAAATAGQLKRPGDSRTFLMRMTKGFQKVAVTALCERIRLADGAEAVLLAVPAGAMDPKPAECARQMLVGFDDPSTHVAVLDETGGIISASAQFDSLQLTQQTARMLVTLAGGGRERLVKRPVPTAFGYLPGAVAKLSDEPALHLLFLVQPETGAPQDPDLAIEDAAQPEEAAEAAEAPEAEHFGTAPEEPLPVDDVLVEQPGLAVVAPDFEEALTAVSAIDELEDEAEEESPFTPIAEDVATADDAGGDETLSDGQDSDAEPAEPAPELAAAAQDAVSEGNAPEVSAPIAQAAPSARAEATPVFSPRTDARAMRFVWKIDAEGLFREVSPELAAAVGPHAADVVGLSFADVAALFNLDPDGKIDELLRRRDTWSGKTIRWPIEGTSLAVPIDLAALPTYTRSREFDGFRGFGILRMADAQPDPLATGLVLAASEAERQALRATTPADEPGVADEAEPAAAMSPVPDDDVFDDAVPLAASPEPANVELVPTAEEIEREAQDSQAVATDVEASDADTAAAGPDTARDQPTRFVSVEPPTEELVPSAADALKDAGVPEDDADEQTLDTAANAPAETPTDDSRPATELPATEKPVLRIVDAPSQQFSDKVVRFDERRLTGNDRLTPGEQANFREIARRLDVFRRPDDTLTAAPVEPDAADAQTVATSAPRPAPDDVVPAPDQGLQPDPRAPASETTVEASADSVPADRDDEAGPVAAQEEVFADANDEIAEDGAETTEAEAADDAADLVAEAEEELASAEEAHDDAPDEEEISLSEAYAQAIPLRPRPELSADIIDQMPVALLVHSGDRLIHANPEFLRLTGYTALDALSEVGGLDALLQRQDLEDKTAEAGGMVVVRADDVVVPVSARLQSIRWDGNSALILALMPMTEFAAHPSAPSADTEVDSGELSRLEVEVEELRAILDTATDGVVTIGGEGEIRSMNRAASALFNYDNEETTGRPFVMLFAHESQKSVLDYLAGLAGNGVASLLNDGREVIGREASGGFLPIFMTIGHLSSSHGYCAVIRDITQWKRTEEELRNAKRAAETANAHKSDFLAHVSHEIRTPLNAIIGFADMMATERLGQIGHPRYVEYANDIGRSGRHVLDIVNDLLDISKIEAGEMELDFAAVGLNETVSEAVSLVQPQANSQRVIIRTALSQAVPPVVADLRSIKQIVLNILSNAIRFTPSGGQIVVSSAYEANGNVVLRIRDTGIGMTRAELELAMKPFRQVAGAGRKRGDGTGLGLPLTKAMVDANRAAFAINSAPNEGTLVEITFPSQRVLAN
ncbi:ATP-binding protein [Rhizobium sp. 0TCS1.26]|uniref:ATP-binding protein n=1 Tax=Rhizobium sp. 0TCS1.26 TaxID=3142623 RepID=UPI003D29FE4F